MSENKSTTIYNMKHDIAQILLEDVIKKDPEVVDFLDYVINEKPYYVEVQKLENNGKTLLSIEDRVDMGRDGSSIIEYNEEFEPNQVVFEVVDSLKDLAVYRHENNNDNKITDKDVLSATKVILEDKLFTQYEDNQIDYPSLTQLIEDYVEYCENHEKPVPNVEQLESKLNQYELEHIRMDVSGNVEPIMFNTEKVVVGDLPKAEINSDFLHIEYLPIETMTRLLRKSDEWEDQEERIEFNQNRKEHIQEIIDYVQNDIENNNSGFLRLMVQNNFPLDILTHESNLDNLSEQQEQFRKDIKKELDFADIGYTGYMAYATQMEYGEVLKANIYNALANLSHVDNRLKTGNEELPIKLTDMLSDELKESFVNEGIKIKNVYAGILNSESGRCSAFCMDKFELEIPYKDLSIDLNNSASYGYSVEEIIGPSLDFYTQGTSEFTKLSSQNIAINNELAKNFTQNAEEYLKQLDLELDDKEVTKKRSTLKM
jgi:hypothetical protein